MANINIVLVEPEIPQNTGNIARTCACIGAALHLVRPLGFKIDDKQLLRAGLDYWHFLDITYYDSLADFLLQTKDKPLFFCSTKALHTYAEVTYQEDCFLVFGKETKGLPEEVIFENREQAIRIPMIEGARSLNLSNSVAIVAYEALRQQNFTTLKATGNLTKYQW